MRKKRHHHSGTILILTLVVMPALLAVAVLVIDAGLMFAMRQDLRNAADAAAKTAAFNLMKGFTDLTSTASAVVAEYGLAASQLTVNSPPTGGPFAGQDRYVEVVVTAEFSGIFVSSLSGGQLSVRAVAGHELMPPEHLVTLLNDDDGQLSGANLQSGGTVLLVQGSLAVNSSAGGMDEDGAAVAGDPSYPAVRGDGSMEAYSVQVNGGVEDADAFSYYGGSGPNPLDAGLGIEFPDPYIHLTTPTVATGVLNVDRGAPRATSSSIQLNNPNDDPISPNYVTVDPDSGEDLLVLQPGIYEQIQLLSGANVYFEPGIYVLRRPSVLSDSTLFVAGNARVSGQGIMFYATSSTYDPETGSPDIDDGYATPLDAPSNYGLLEINIGPFVNFSPVDTFAHEYTTSIAAEFNGMLLYKRRRNTHYTQIVLSDTTLDGTIYMRNSRLRLLGFGALNSSVAVSMLDMASSGSILMRQSGTASAQASQVVLVE